LESTDVETLIELGVWFEICGAAEEKARSVPEHAGETGERNEVNDWW